MHLPSLALFVIPPEALGELDILLLTLLDATAQENDPGLAVFAKIDPVAGAEIYPAFEYTGTDTVTLEKFPCSIRTSVVAVLAAASALSRSNHLAYGLRPLASMYSRTSNISDW